MKLKSLIVAVLMLTTSVVMAAEYTVEMKNNGVDGSMVFELPWCVLRWVIQFILYPLLWVITLRQLKAWYQKGQRPGKVK